MNKIQEVKEKSNILRIAQYFNLNLNKSNKCLCPFHSEKTPSFSISETKQIFKCFGCGKGGDCITLVSELLNISAYEAAVQINNIFNLGVDFKRQTSKLEIKKYKCKSALIEQFKNWENETFKLLCDYNRLLSRWKKIEDFENDLFVEALRNKDYIEYLIDEYFINGTDEDKIWFYQNQKKLINKIRNTLSIEKGVKNERYII